MNSKNNFFKILSVFIVFLSLIIFQQIRKYQLSKNNFNQKSDAALIYGIVICSIENNKVNSMEGNSFLIKELNKRNIPIEIINDEKVKYVAKKISSKISPSCFNNASLYDREFIKSNRDILQQF